MKKILLLLMIIPVLFLSACVLKFNAGSGSDSGFFLSQNKAEEWVQKVELMNIGEGRSFFNNAKVTFLKTDPQDPQALYVGSMANGVLYSFNKGESWQRTLTQKGVIHDLAVDPQDKCTIYVAAGNKVYKTKDCMRHWENIHIEGLPEQSIKAVAVDDYNNNKIYIGTSGGGLFKSYDYGVSWESIRWFNSTINKIMINPKDTAEVYVATSKKGLHKSNNEGINWINISDNITYRNERGDKVLYDGAYNYLDLEFDYSERSALIYANSYGLFYTDNGGQEWKHIKLLSQPQTVTIWAVAMNPNNNKEIYYATSATLYKSIDGGREWTTENLPSSKRPIDLLVDIQDGNNLFMIVREVKD
jgi:photosystem II stability/assembly factor-like uncharacterized protein